MPTVIKNGTLVTASDIIKADLLIDGEKIAVIGEGLETEGAQVIDATDRYVLPGGIDVHTHLQLPVGVTESSDDFYTGHKAAAFGGTTTPHRFCHPQQGRAAAQRHRGVASQGRRQSRHRLRLPREPGRMERRHHR